MKENILSPFKALAGDIHGAREKCFSSQMEFRLKTCLWAATKSMTWDLYILPVGLQDKRLFSQGLVCLHTQG